MSKLVAALTDVGSATTSPPSSGTGIIGWLRGIYDRLFGGQTLDANNTTVRTSANGATQYVGNWSVTRATGELRTITVVASDVTSGLGGTFEFQFSEDGSTPTIDEVRSIGDFATVREFDLMNFGAYYRVKFTPSRALTGSEHVFITTQTSKRYPGPFVRLANQEIEEANAAMPQTFAYLKLFNEITGKSVNIRPTALGEIRVADESLEVTESGSLFTESIRDDISLTFSRDGGATTISSKLAVVAGTAGSVAHDATEGRAVFSTGAGAGSTVYYESVKTAVYESGHMIRGEQTIEINTAPTGTQKIEWGYGEDDGAGDVLNGIGWGIDATGLYVFRKKAGAYANKVYRTSFTDKLDASATSRFRINGTPVAYQALKNTLYRVGFEWLGAASPSYEIGLPQGGFIPVYEEPTANQITGTTLPEPKLPLFIRAYNGAGGNLQVSSGSWRGGIHTAKSLVQGALTASTGQQDVTTVSTAISTAFTGRTSVRLKNMSTSARPLQFGFSGTLTALNGDELAIGESIDVDLDTGVSLYVITTSTAGAGVRCSWTELGA